MLTVACVDDKIGGQQDQSFIFMTIQNSSYVSRITDASKNYEQTYKEHSLYPESVNFLSCQKSNIFLDFSLSCTFERKLLTIVSN